MGATRKLQGEIDRVLKKVQEGVDVFDSIWNKVYDTENANQKEKFEADLKKEIKKLQRYRDQIKTWIQSSEIKDKKVAASYEQCLLDARKQIEREMERFKICEKETKTKAFSKEGLGLQPKTDPKEKAKGDSRDWLNNMVSELESQIDSFEAETEGLSVKKGKTRPPRLTHLEDSISRHKQHIMKLEQILRLLDNDELSPEEVNDVRDLVEDYVERNQDDFDEFSEVDNLYESLPLEKMEALDSLETTPATPVPLGKEKAAGAAGSVEESPVAEPIAVSPPEAQAPALSPSAHSSEALSGTSPVTSADSPSVGIVSSPSVSIRTLAESSPGGSTPASKPPLQIPLSAAMRPKEEDANGVVGRRFPISEASIGRTSAPGTGLGTVGVGVQAPARIPLNPGNSLVGGSVTVSSSVGAEGSQRMGLGTEDRVGNATLTQQLALAQSRMLATGSKLAESSPLREGGPMPDGAARVFSPPLGPSGQWRPHLQSPEPGEYGYSGVAPDLKQNFLNRFNQINQQNQGVTLLNPIAASKQQTVLSSQQRSGLLQQNLQNQQLLQQQQQQVPLSQPFQSVVAQQQQQQQALLKSVSSQLLNTANSQSQQVTSQQALQMPISSDVASPDNARSADQSGQMTEDNTVEKSGQKSAFPSSLSLISEDDLKNHDTFDVSVGGPGSLGDFRELPRESDFSPGQMAPMQTAAAPGIIGRRDNLGAIGDNLMLGMNAAGHDQQYNKDALASAYLHVPLPQDSDRPKSYIPRNPAVTPSSYPQVPVHIIDNPALWEHLDTEILFFAFYFQQGTYQQYMAARELKKQSWRYHKKYNTWFQRHEEPKITTDEYEQGTYVYFDFHIVHDDHQQGWCQRIKTEFTFEYSYLEDELIV